MHADYGHIRLARADEIDALAQLKLRTFRETFLDEFAIPYPPADLAVFEAEMYSPERLEQELSDPQHRTWVVDHGGALVAYAHIGPCKLPHPQARPEHVELYQLYVAGEAQGRGVGKRLMDLMLGPPADGLSAPSWLGVWSGNSKAQELYAGKGFSRVGEYKFRVGTWFDEEYIFRRTV